jgi:hypothetical protein
MALEIAACRLEVVEGRLRIPGTLRTAARPGERSTPAALQPYAVSCVALRCASSTRDAPIPLDSWPSRCCRRRFGRRGSRGPSVFGSTTLRNSRVPTARPAIGVAQPPSAPASTGGISIPVSTMAGGSDSGQKSGSSINAAQSSRRPARSGPCRPSMPSAPRRAPKSSRSDPFQRQGGSRA